MPAQTTFRRSVQGLLAVAVLVSAAAFPAAAGASGDAGSATRPASAIADSVPSVAGSGVVGAGSPRPSDAGPGVRTPRAAQWTWIDGGWGWHYEPDCVTGGITNHNTYTGYYGATDGSGPLTNEIYYMHVGFSVGGGCAGGVAASLWAWLPPGTTVQPSAQYPVRCLWDSLDGRGWKDISGSNYSDCKLDPQADGSGKYYFGTPQIPNFTLYEVWFPVKSTQKLIGSAGSNGGHKIQAEVMIGTSNPMTTYPKGWVWVTDGTSNQPQISVSYPDQPVTDLTCTGAKTTGHVYNQFTSGNAWIDIGRDGHGVEASAGPVALANTESAYAVFVTWNLASEQRYRWKVRYISGGQTYTGAEKTFTTPDCVAPNGSLSINNGAASTASANVTLNLNASDVTGVTQMRISDDNANWTSWMAYATTRAWTLPTIPGTRTVYAQFRDAAGNVSASASDSIRYDPAPPPDTTPPTGSISIDGGAASTTSTSVTLTLSATDAIGVTQMRLSDDGTSWDAWVAYATSKAWTLTAGAGTKTVHVQYRDAALNVSQTAADSISYQPPASDTTPPVVAAPSANVVARTVLGTSTVPVRVTWPVAQDLSGISGYELQQSVNGGAFTPVTLSSTTARAVVVNLTPGASSYRFQLRATDGAGNTSAFVAGPSFKLGRLQENSTKITYTGTWTRAALADASGGFVRHASARTARAGYTFNGRGIAIAMTAGSDRGRVQVVIDGTVVKTVDLYSAATKTRQIVFATTFAAGSHTIELRVLGLKNAASTGTRVDLDAIVVTQ